MNPVYTKIQLLFLRFIYLWFGFAAIYVLLYWISFIEWAIISLKDDVVHCVTQ